MAQALDNLNLNIGVNVTGLGQIQQVQTRMARLDRTINASTKSYNSSSVALNKFAKGAMQQAGYQIGDYAVQVANGTSAMQAFGQQGSQLLGIFGPVGAVLGAAVAIFSAIAVAAERSGKEVQNVGSAFGVLQAPIESVVAAVQSVQAAFSGSMSIIVNNIDTAIIAIGLFAGYMGIRYVAGMAAATASTFTFQGAMYSLGVAVGRVQMLLARFLPVAIFLLIAKAIELFLRLKEGAGSAGEAFVLLGDLMREVFEKIKANVMVFVTAWRIAFNQIKFVMASAIGDMAITFGKFIDGMTEKLNSAFNLNLSTGFADDITGALQGVLNELNDEAAALYAAQEAHIKAATKPLESWQKLKDAIAAGTTEVSIFGDAVEAETGKGAAGANKLKDALEDVKSISERVADAVKGPMESGFMAMIDGTKSVTDAFKDMARDIIKELYRVLVVQRLVNSIAGAIGFMAGPATGNTGTLGLPSFDGGGWTGSGARAGGIDGKGGYPAIIHPREQVVDTTKGASTGSINITQNITFGSGVSRAEINSMLPKIVETTKAAVFDAQRRRVNGFA